MLNVKITTIDTPRKRKARETIPLVVSPSSLSLFRECRRKFKLKYIDKLVPEAWEDAEPLSFGKLIDLAMELRNDGADWAVVLAWLDSECRDRATDPQLAERYARAVALLRGYAEKYQSDTWQFVGVQVQVEGNVTNPDSPRSKGAKFVSFAGWLDGLILWDGQLWVYELKTTSRIDGAYLDSLWQAPQTGLYALYTERTLGIPVAGVLYDICQKSSAQTVRRDGETEDEFEARAAELRSINKSGKTTAKRQIPESWDEFTERLVSIHARPEMYRREAIPITLDRLAAVESDLWMQSRDMTTARQQGTFYRNDRSCLSFGRECEYLALCRSNMSPIIQQNLYRRIDEQRTEIVNDLTHAALAISAHAAN
jgi:hypothetical protein